MKLTAVLTLVISATVACSSSPGPRTFEPPGRSILVVPVTNNSLNVEAPDIVLSTLPTQLAGHGYYVFPVHTVKTVLAMEGYTEGAPIRDIPAEQLAALFDADSILYVTIEHWTAMYAVIAAETRVTLRYELVDRYGQELWSHLETASRGSNENRNRSGENSGAVLLGMVIDAAIQRAAPQYMTLLQEANDNAFHRRNWPRGPYPEEHTAEREIHSNP